MLAAQSGRADMVSYLLDQGADPTLLTKVGRDHVCKQRGEICAQFNLYHNCAPLCGY